MEAQAHGLPVISSNESCLPEVLEDSVIYFDPRNEIDIIKKINLILNDQNLRGELVIKGRENIKRFSWEKMISETEEIYEYVLGTDILHLF